VKSEIYITGSRGLVGSRFVELQAKNYCLLTPEVETLDITDKKSLKAFFEKEKPEVVVHFAAFTDVGEAESQKGNKKGACWQINVEGSKNLAEFSARYNSHLIHISTDYVFSGSKEDKGPYPEDHLPEADENKVTWYGFTKAEAERSVKETLGEKAAILRINYPVRAKYENKLDYLRKPLSLYDQGKLYPMFADQELTITFIDEAVKALEKIINGDLKGIFHAASGDTSTPYELVSYLLEKARGVKNAVKSAKLTDFIAQTKSSPVRYPQYGGLKVEATEKILEIKFSTCREIIDELILQGLGKDS
jgi:dTDP-4-dehydrorhamnose reductase